MPPTCPPLLTPLPLPQAESVRLNGNGDKPAVLGQLRINSSGKGEQAYRTIPATASCSPEWNQQFVLPGRSPPPPPACAPSPR